MDSTNDKCEPDQALDHLRNDKSMRVDEHPESSTEHGLPTVSAAMAIASL